MSMDWMHSVAPLNNTLNRGVHPPVVMIMCIGLKEFISSLILPDSMFGDNDLHKLIFYVACLYFL